MQVVKITMISIKTSDHSIYLKITFDDHTIFPSHVVSLSHFVKAQHFKFQYVVYIYYLLCPLNQ
jgi:hypothetical protein